MMVATQGWAQTAPPASAAPGNAAPNKGIEEILVTAEKREQKLQKVPASVQVLDSKTLSQLNITEFQDYIKYLPSLNQQTLGPNQTSVYLRGVADGDNMNHSGPLPTVGTYLDEIPITTIGGTLDVHIYDVARVETLPGPQGTLYGASSESGTMQIVTVEPKIGKFEAGYDVQGSETHGAGGFVGEGFVNIPVTDNVAVRLVAYDEHDAGYINNVYGTRYLPTTGVTINNAALVKDNFNPADSFGGRAELKYEVNEDWTILPVVLAQDQRNTGVFGFQPSVGDLEVQRFQPDRDHDRWAMAGLTVRGKLGDYSLTFASGLFVRDDHQYQDYTDYTVAYDAAYGSYYVGKNGQPLAAPLQYIENKDHFTKYSNELRLASPSTDRLRFIVGAFQEDQTHRILQDYLIQGFDPAYSIPGWANTIWLTDQLRTDRDAAVYGEVSYDITPQFTVTGGVRGYYYANSLYGFFGFSHAFDDFYGSNTGMGQTVPGNCQVGKSYSDAPCVNLNGNVFGSGETHKINLTYKIDPDRLVYFTYSTGYRPGGDNRLGSAGPYQADTLTNYEVGFKTSWLEHRLTLNGALFYEDWSNFQFSYLGPNSFTIVKNAPNANIKGIELAAIAQPLSNLTLTGGVTLTDAALTQAFCTNTSGVVLSNCAPGTYSPTSYAPSGTLLPYTPPVKGDVTARYTFPFYDWNAHVQSGIVIVGRNQAGLRQDDKIVLGSMPSYESVDLLAGIERNRLSVELFIKNLFDDRGEVNRYVPCTIGECTKVYAVPIQPFTVGLKLSQRF
jgi:outer membrane receptor protein involved in Fe transport